MKGRTIKVFIVDDHSLFRECLSDAFKNIELDIQVVGQAEDGQGLVRKIKETKCNVILLDIIIPGFDSMELLKTLKIEFPKIPILMLSSHSEENFGPRYLKAGASGYFCKIDSLDNLITSVKKVFAGEVAISASLSNLIVQNSLSPKKLECHDALSDREFQVMCLMGSGVQLSEVARRLNISPKTVSGHRCKIMEKMGWKNNAEMMRYAIENGFAF
ncbi:MAG: response regulator [Calditrichia bacterium]